jgi:hypothetical protein
MVVAAGVDEDAPSWEGVAGDSGVIGEKKTDRLIGTDAHGPPKDDADHHSWQE